MSEDIDYNGLGRPPLPPDIKKAKQITIRLTNKLYEILKNESDVYDEKPAVLIRKILEEHYGQK